MSLRAAVAFKVQHELRKASISLSVNVVHCIVHTSCSLLCYQAKGGDDKAGYFLSLHLANTSLITRKHCKTTQNMNFLLRQKKKRTCAQQVGVLHDLFIRVYSHDRAQNEEQRVEERHEREARKGSQEAPLSSPYGKVCLKPQERPRKNHEKQVAVHDGSCQELVDRVPAGGFRGFVNNVRLQGGDREY